jgi:hypothetical protein
MYKTLARKSYLGQCYLTLPFSRLLEWVDLLVDGDQLLLHLTVGDLV